jgi:hypothetical protein
MQALYPPGPYMLCWVIPGTRVVVRGRIGARSVAEAVQWAVGYRDLLARRGFWLEAA